jgi:glycosyltransferase involved in cell wall biosynthesis
MPSYNNFTEVFFTVQSFRMYHDLTDCEILIVDNFGDDKLFGFVKKYGAGVVRYERAIEKNGVSHAKNRVFDHARGEYVMCIDSHILVKPGALDIVPPGDDFVQGPFQTSDCTTYKLSWKDEWSSQMWGKWDDPVTELPEDTIEIWGTGAGFFSCRRDSWLGFNENFRGFGGETGYIQEKYRQHGRKILCDPKKVWMHFFGNDGRNINYPLKMVDRIINYILGFDELGLSKKPIYAAFGQMYPQAVAILESEGIKVKPL